MSTPEDGKSTFTVVEATLGNGSSKTLYFDQATDLLTRISTKAAVGPGGEMSVEMVASDFKKIDGIKILHTMTMIMGPQKVIMKFTEVKHNMEIDDDLFKMKK